MHTTFKSALLAASMLVCVSAKAGEVDGVNSSRLPAVVGFTYGSYSQYSGQVFAYDTITYQYVPSFDYTLTGLFTRFSTAGLSTLTNLSKIEISIYTPSLVVGATPVKLLDFTFDLVPGTIDLHPSTPGKAITGTEWLGDDTFNALFLSAGTSYFIHLNALSSTGTPLSLTSVGVNTASPSASLTLPGVGSATTWLPTYITPDFSGTAIYTDPIFSFQGTPVTPVPEPSTYGLIGAFGLMSFAAIRRRFARKS